jgi:DNA-binding response OmpR family regulator
VQLVFVVGGESKVGQFAQYHLQLAGFAVRVLSTEDDVIKRAERACPSLIVIDDTTLASDGPGLCRRIRANCLLVRTPVLLLAAEASEQQRVVGLEAGADDYIPILPGSREFIARTKALMRRFARTAAAQPANSPMSLGDIEVDTFGMKVSVRGEQIETTILEFRLIYYLTHHRTRVFTRDQLLDAVWGGLELNPRCVDACVRRLRRKIEPDYNNPTYLKTIRGAGYCWSAA